MNTSDQNTIQRIIHRLLKSIKSSFGQRRPPADPEPSRPLLKAVLSRLGVAMLLIDPETRAIMDCNETAEQLFQLGRADLVGGTTDSLHATPDACQVFESEAARAVGDQGWFVGEAPMRRSNGDSFPAEYTILQIPDADAAGSFGIHMIRDMSERNKREADALETQKLVAIGTLSVGIAHDFNNMLGIVLGCAELIPDEVPQVAEDNPRIVEIVNTCLRAREVIQQLLNLGRSSVTEHPPQPVASGVVFKEAADLLRFAMPRKVVIQTDFADDLHNVMAVPVQLHQMILHLGINALQSMEAGGGGTLAIRLKNVELSDDPELPAGSYVQLEVTDTGAGMAQEALGKGAEIGLAVVHGIVTEYGGSISVTSAPGSGTAIRILLPATHQSVAGAVAKKAALEMGQGHVLFVDDEPMMVEMGRQVLKSIGYFVAGFKSAEEALRYLKNTTEVVDLLITDLSMPVTDGLQLGEAVRAERPDLPMVLCTGVNTNLNRQAAREIGFSGFLAKPYGKKDLSSVIADVLSIKKP